MSSNRGYKRRRRNSWVGDIPKYVRQVYTAAKAAGKMYNSYNKTTKKEGPDVAITTQKDSMQLYKRRRAPRSVRRKARKRHMRHLFQELRQANDNTNLFNQNFSFTNGAGVQKLNSIMFGYLNPASTSVDEVGTIREAFDNFLNSDVASSSNKFYITGISYDITITNATGTSNDNGISCELDIYEIVCRKPHEFEKSGIASMEALYAQAIADEDQLPGSGANMTASTVGYTPFDSNQMSQFFIIKNKQRYYLPRNESISFVRDVKFKKAIKLTSENFNDVVSAGDIQVYPSITRGLLLVQKGTSSNDGTQFVGSTLIRCSVQCRYRFKVLDKDNNQQGFGL